MEMPIIALACAVTLLVVLFIYLFIYLFFILCVQLYKLWQLKTFGYKKPGNPGKNLLSQHIGLTDLTVRVLPHPDAPFGYRGFLRQWSFILCYVYSVNSINLMLVLNTQRKRRGCLNRVHFSVYSRLP